MTWLTWRQFRIPALSMAVGLVVIGVLLLVSGLEMVGETNFSDEDFMFIATTFAMYLLPAVVGVFWGVPMVTRELETGTHSLVWNQTVTRERWLATKLGVGAPAAMAAAGLLSIAVGWWASPIDTMAALEPQNALTTRISPLVFATRGLAPVGYAAFAFVLGIAVGILLRRTVTAMAVTLVVFVAVMVAVPLLVRPYVLPASEETVAVTPSNLWQIYAEDPETVEYVTVFEPAGSWVLTNETVDAAGNAVTPLPDAAQGCMPPLNRDEPAPTRQPLSECFSKTLTDAGYQQHLVYHPASHFWPLQWIELGFFLALSALLAWFCFRRVRHLS